MTTKTLDNLVDISTANYYADLNIVNGITDRYSDYDSGVVRSTLGYPGSADVISGTSNPDWKILVSKGLDASSPYRHRTSSFVPVYLSTFVKAQAAWYLVREHTHQRSMTLMPDEYTETDSVLRDVALSRVKRRIKSKEANFDALVPIVELRELRRLVTSSATLTSRFVETALALRSLKRLRPRDALKRLGEAWLTWSFGVSPIVSDTVKLTESIRAYLDRNDHRSRVTGQASRDWVTTNRTGSGGAYGTNDWIHGRFTHELSYKFVALHHFDLTASNSYTLSQHLGLGPVRIIPAAWELVPWSWIADYFGTVGQFLDDTYSAAPSLIFIVENRKYKIVGRLESFAVKSGVVDDSILEFRTDVYRPGSYEHFDFERIVLGSLPSSLLRFKTADEVGVNVVKRLLNLVSLLVSTRR